MEEEIKKDQPNELEVCKKQSEEYLNNWKRSAADFINYKKDEMERMSTLAHYAKESMIIKILPLLDSIYLSEKELPDTLKTGEKGSPKAIEWTKGFLQIKKQVSEFLKKEGVEEITTEGKPFDPNFMEIVQEVDLSSEALAEKKESGTVIEELQKGYIMQGKVVRPARVKISK